MFTYILTTLQIIYEIKNELTKKVMCYYSIPNLNMLPKSHLYGNLIILRSHRPMLLSLFNMFDLQDLRTWSIGSLRFCYDWGKGWRSPNSALYTLILRVAAQIGIKNRSYNYILNKLDSTRITHTSVSLFEATNVIEE